MSFLNFVWSTPVVPGTAWVGWVGALLVLAAFPLSRLGLLIPVSPQGSRFRYVRLIASAIGWSGVVLCTVAVFTAEPFRPWVLPLMGAGLIAGSVLIDLAVGRITRT